MNEREWVVEQYQEGKSAYAISQELGRHRTTIHNWLNAAGVEIRDDRLKINRKLSPKCQKGLHEFTPENTRIDKKGGRHCRQCERDYAMIRYYSVNLGA